MEGSNFNQIARDYHLKRKKPWRPLEFFLNHLKNKGYVFNGICLDLGCGNGRNFKILGNPPKKLIGIDISIELLKIARDGLNDIDQYAKFESNFIQILLGDLRQLPIRPNSATNIFTIASIHHIIKKSERKNTLSHFYNVLKKNGCLILTVWRKWQKTYRGYFLMDWMKRNFAVKHRKLQEKLGLEEFGDKIVPWTILSEKKVYHRFYHFFSKHEIKKLLRIFKIREFKIMGGPNNRDNFFIFAQKNKS